MENVVSIEVYVPTQLFLWLREYAKEEQTCVSELVHGILEDYQEAVTGIKVSERDTCEECEDCECGKYDAY